MKALKKMMARKEMKTRKARKKQRLVRHTKK